MPSIFIAFDAPQSAPAGALRAHVDRAQRILRANMVAQITAFAYGEQNDDPNKRFVGSRPSALLYGQRLTPFTLGALLSFFENRVMFQGFLWNVNSFDQEGVQLGKRLANAILDADSADATTDSAASAATATPTDAALRQYQRLFERL